MADILLSVGLQSGSAEFNDFFAQLQSQINSAKNGKGTEIKVKPVIDSKALDAQEKAQRAQIDAMEKVAQKRAEVTRKAAEEAEREEQRRAEEKQRQAEKEIADAERVAQKKADAQRKENERAAAEEEAASKKREQALLSVERAIKKVEEAQRNWSKAGTGESADSYKNLDTIKQKFEALKQELESWTPDQGVSKINGIVRSMTALNTEFTSSERTIRNSGEATKAFTAGLSSVESRLAYMFSIGNAIMLATRQIKNMAKTTTELDSAMTQLRVVTNASETDYANYGSSVASTAKEIGASITDLIDSTTVYARLGYTLEESSNLAKYTAMLSNVGDIDVSTAQDSLTAITKAFKDVTANNIEVAMDKMVAVGNNFPISVSQIAEGMNNAGSALAAAGNSFDESVALLTAANTTVQNISKSSTGLRTITARIRGTKAELDDLGEVIEEAKYQEALDLLTGKNVKLTDNGEFRSTYEILKDISSVWDSLTSMQQANIAEQLAGKICCCCPSAPKRCA